MPAEGETGTPGRLVVVSNRLPLTLRRSGGAWRAERSAGGLVTALDPIMKQAGGLWVGWPGEAGEADDEARAELLQRWEEEHGFVAVDLPKQTARAFYSGYSNRAIWPLFHDFPSRLDYEPEMWAAYEAGNRAFCDALVGRLEPGDRIWVHDYHLMLLPGMLREALPDATIGFFLHIPFPSSDLFRVLPGREQVLTGLLGADYVAFQTHRHLQHFRSALLRIRGVASHMDRIDVHGRTVRMDAAPIGIVPREFYGLLDDDAGVAAERAELGRRYAGLQILLAVDRLDYTKGIPERLRAYRRLLDRAPHLCGKVVLLQVAVPSREKLSRYRELSRQVNELVGEINGQFATPDWTPVIYIRRAIPRAELVALYAVAAVGWVTPLRDGMNLVAKEYVACQRGGEGVLLLSEFAGAATEMGEAFIVNPHDEEETAVVLERALALDPAERRERMLALLRRVERNTAFAWSSRFLDDLERAAVARRGQAPELPPLLDPNDAERAARNADRRLVLLDYDGSLVPFANRPREAVPPQELLDLLARLASVPGQLVAIVSGRSSASLLEWFGEIPGLWLAAEHGATLRDPAQRRWEPPGRRVDLSWMDRVRTILERWVDRLPGSFVEEKEFSLVWHYRMSDPEFGEWLAKELASTLADLLVDMELRVVRGARSLEVRMAWVNKGEIVEPLERRLRPDFRLALGDDRTDEDLFARLPEDAWTIHVGEKPSRARYRIEDYRAARALLARLTG